MDGANKGRSLVGTLSKLQLEIILSYLHDIDIEVSRQAPVASIVINRTMFIRERLLDAALVDIDVEAIDLDTQDHMERMAAILGWTAPTKGEV